MKIKKLLVAISLMLLLALGSTSHAAVVADYTFDDIAPGAVSDGTVMTDFGGAGHHGTIVNDGTAAVSPASGTTAILMGPVYGEISQTWGLGASDHTIEVVCDFTNPGSGPTGRGCVIGIWNTGVSYWTIERDPDQRILYQPGPGGEGGWGVGDYTLYHDPSNPPTNPITGWHVVAFTRELYGDVKLYLDGVVVGSTIDTWGAGEMDGVFRIGLTPWLDHLAFNNLVDRVRVSDHIVPLGNMITLTSTYAPVAMIDVGDGLTVAEDSGSDTYTIVMRESPPADCVDGIKVILDPCDLAGEITVSPNPVPPDPETILDIIFTTANWDTPQTVTVTAVGDSVCESDEIITLAHSLAFVDPGYTSSEPNFASITFVDSTVDVLVIDNEPTIPNVNVLVDWTFDDIAPGPVADPTPMLDSEPVNGGDNSGEIIGGSNAFVAGHTTAVLLGAPDAFVYAEEELNLGLGLGDFTIEVVAYFAGDNTRRVIIGADSPVWWSLEDTTSGGNPAIEWNSYYGYGGASTKTVVTAFVQLEGWHSVAIRRTLFSDCTMFIDGQEVATSPDLYELGNMDGMVRVGRAGASLSYEFRGYYDRIRISNNAVDASDMIAADPDANDIPVPPDQPLPKPGGNFQEQVLFTAGEGGYTLFRIPSLLVTSTPGVVLAFAEGRITGTGDNSVTEIVMRRSVDGGRTWSEKQVVVESQAVTTGNPCAVFDRDTGTCFLVFCRGNSEDIRNETAWVTTSTDDGLTWSEPVDITSSVKDDNWHKLYTGPGHGIQLSTGRLLIPCVGEYGAQFSYMVYSDDHGVTWQRGEKLVGEATLDPLTPWKNIWGGYSPDDVSDECDVVELADGRLYLNARSRLNIGYRAYAYSSDGGITWSEAKFHPDLPESVVDGGVARLLVENLLLVSCPTFQYEEGMPYGTWWSHRQDMTISVSSDDGNTWPVSTLIHEGPSAYSDLAVLPDGNILCFYEGGQEWRYETMILARFGLDSVYPPEPFAWTFGNAGIQSYVLESFEPNELDFGTIGAEDPTLTLHLGKRYQVTIVDYASHPFEVIAKAEMAAGDTILLALGATEGSFESDPNVGWVDNGAGTVTFTFSTDVSNNLIVPDKIPCSRCGIHYSTMRVDFNVCTSQIKGDLNGNCEIELSDLCVFAGQWLDPPGSCSGLVCADLDGVGGVGMVDWATIVDNWLQSNLVYN